MPRKRSRYFLVSAVAALFLVVAESAALSHLDVDGHPAGESCALCVSLASFGAGNVVATVRVEIDATTSSPLLITPSGVLRRALAAHAARGPPTTS